MVIMSAVQICVLVVLRRGLIVKCIGNAEAVLVQVIVLGIGKPIIIVDMS